MKTLFIPAKIKSKVNEKKISLISNKLPKNIVVAYSVQYENQAKKIKNILSENHKIIQFVQVLGCSKINFPKNTDAVLLVSSGKFHGISLAVETGLPIYIVEENSLKEISKKEIENLKKRKKGAYLKFLHADRIGILVSTKPGQENLKNAIEFKKNLKNKKSYLFVGNNINTSEFENFGLDCWVNTACPRLDMASNEIINLGNCN